MDQKKVIAQFEAIRRLGQTNMFDRNMVERIAYENGFYEMVNAIEDDQIAFIFKHYSEWMKLVDDADIPEARPVEATWRLR